MEPTPDPAHPAAPPILASDADRERVVVVLRDAVGEGRLTLEEFSQRVGLAQRARTETDLTSLCADLPASAAPALDEPEDHRAVCSHLTRSGLWSLPARSSWRSYFGTVDLDLRQARLSSAETELHVYNLFGTVTVIVPEGLEVVVRGGGAFASQKIDTAPSTPGPGSPKLIIETRGPGGTLQVRTRPPLRMTLKSLVSGL